MPVHPKDIHSRNNPVFKRCRKLLTGRGPKKYGRALLSGPKQVEETARDFPGHCEGIILQKDRDPLPEGLPREIRIFRFAPELFREIDIYGTGRPLLRIRVGPLPRWTDGKWPRGCTLFCPFQDPGNVGTVIRSSAAFGVSRVVLLKESAHPFHHKAIRAAGSALFRVPLLEGPSIKSLKSDKRPLFTLDARGEDIQRFVFPDTFGLVPGMEGPGISFNLRNLASLRIPMVDGVDSINASTAAGIALFMWQTGCRQSP